VARTIIESRVIPWDGVWDVAIRYSDHTKVAYPVGSREDAEREVLQPRPPDPNPDPVENGLLVLAD
jgi:hypothetical protein